MEEKSHQDVDAILIALGELRWREGDRALVQFLRRLAKGDARRLRAFLDLSSADLDEALRAGLSRLTGAELAEIAARLSSRPDEPLDTLSHSASVRHTLLTRACGRLLDARPLDPGDKIDGRYEVLELVGVGGMGIVYHAADRQAGGEVAVKLLRAELARDRVCVSRFRKSVKLCRELDHPGIVRSLDASLSDDGPYLVMEWIAGPTLRGLLDERERLSWNDAARIVIRVLRALGYAHAKGVLHLDLKPENVLIADRGEPKICDFDLARVVERTQGLSLLPGAGTPDYMAPEQRREGKVDRRTDVYAAGVLIYELLSGRLPGRYTPMLHLEYGVPPEVSRAVEASLHDNPDRRPADATAFLAAMALPEADPEIESLMEEAEELLAENPPSGEPASQEGTDPVAEILTELGVTPDDPAESEASARIMLTGDATLRPVGKNADGFAELVNIKDRSDLILVSPSTFVMGSNGPGDADERPSHEVVLGGFLIGKYAVTNAQYALFCKEMRRCPPKQPDPGWGYERYFLDPDFAHYPVVGVSWNDAVEYCTWAGLRLPTEAEWERAAGWSTREGRASQFPWGDEAPSPRYAVFWRPPEHGAYTELVGLLPDGASACGAMDMAGNVWEWCSDWYDEAGYATTSGWCRNPKGPKYGDERIIRGGAWYNTPDMLRCGVRDCEDPHEGYNAVGFRVARDLR